ncbi:hypothetical protein MTO96_011278 [Rhipicephalus appendiculatus]
MNKAREANETLRQENAALRTTINNLTREIAEIRKLLLGNTEPPQRPTPITSKTEETNTNSQEAAAEEPGRRVARAKASIDLHANDEHARYVDAAEYQRNAFAAVVIEAATGATGTAASVKSSGAEQAEQVAIALAIADPGCHMVLSDSRQAVRNFSKGQICLSVGLLTHYLNDRILVVMATLISATGLVLCYTATTMVQINFYYSISQGLGTGLVFTLTAVILNNVFKKNRATASGINLSGPTLVALVFPLLFQYCARTYGLRGAFLISSGFTLNALPAAFLQSGRTRKPPPPEEMNPRYDCELNITGSTFTLSDQSTSSEKPPRVLLEKLLDVSSRNNNDEHGSKQDGTLPQSSKFSNVASTFKELLCSPYFLLVCLSQVSHVFNHGTFITIIIDYAKDNGIPPEQGIYILLANSAGDLVGRLGLGWISDKKLIERRKVMLLNYLLTGILMHLAPLCTTYAAVTAIAVAMALAGGSTITLFSVLFFEYLGIRLMPLAYGLSNFAAGNANFFRPRVIGYYRDSHGKYDGLFQLLGSFQLFVSFLWLLSCVFEKMKNSKDASKQQQDV